MKYIYFLLLLGFGFCGCATKMSYVNTAKTAEEIENDETACKTAVDTSDFKDVSLRQNKLYDCMKDKGYRVVSEEEAEKIQGFHHLWIKPGSDLKPYEAIFIDNVDVSSIKVGDTLLAGTKAKNEDIDNLSKKMLESFSKSLGEVMPIIADRKEAKGRKILYISLKLDKVSPTDVGLSTALEAAGQFTVVPLPDAPEGASSFEGKISDLSTNEALVVFADECKEDKNSSLAGLDNFSKWQHTYNIIDYWADHLAALVAKERRQEYKSKLGIKLF